ncbi:MAG: toll/interleukin-1 receptor domain-containing protein [Proteobacteria bacterium]|nr:toll/interleukin-1 receptor domain-containing protein [Pseudomonadota bacterium]
MANQEHLKILRSGGVDAWREFVQGQKYMFRAQLEGADLSAMDLQWVDLHGGNLHGADLQGTDLVGANLEGANLKTANLARANLFAGYFMYAEFQGANLIGANLRRADLREANLHEANLFEADLRGANLWGANLQGANFRRATLQRANLQRANLVNANLWDASLQRTLLNGTIFSDTLLRNTNFQGAGLGGTIFSDCDLSHAIGLSEVIHHAPSTIGIDTLFQSGGNIPDHFLRHAGVPQNLIEASPSLIGNPSEYFSCFISYSSKNEDFADRFKKDLQNQGVRCWLASESLKSGRKIRHEIDKMVKMQDMLLIILSQKSLAGFWMENEVGAALERERVKKNYINDNQVLFPITIDDAIFTSQKAWAKMIRSTREISDFRSWQDPVLYRVALERLVKDLKGSMHKEFGYREAGNYLQT